MGLGSIVFCYYTIMGPKYCFIYFCAYTNSPLSAGGMSKTPVDDGNHSQYKYNGYCKSTFLW